MDRKQLRQVKKAGCQVKRSASSHYKIYFNGRYIATAASSTGDVRSWHNLMAQLRRNGVEI